MWNSPLPAPATELLIFFKYYATFGSVNGTSLGGITMGLSILSVNLSSLSFSNSVGFLAISSGSGGLYGLL